MQQDSLFVEKVVATYSNAEFIKDISKKSFTHAKFDNIGAKDVQFIECTFMYCEFNKCYFRNAKFSNCKFVGCRFFDCNFRGTKLILCEFDYSYFMHTILPIDQFISILPSRPNVKREMCRILRKNAESVGDQDAVKILILEEMEASREHHKKAFCRKESYYKDPKYAKPFTIINNFNKYCSLTVSKFIWGYGERPIRLVITTSLLIFIISLIDFIVYKYNTITLNNLVVDYFSVFVGVSLSTINVSPLMQAVIIIIRYIFIGLLINLILRKYVNR